MSLYFLPPSVELPKKKKINQCDLSKPNETRRNMGMSIIPMRSFVSKSPQKGNPLSLSQFRFNIIYQFRKNLNWL